MTTTDITVQGMTCEHCVASVTEELQEIPGVTEVRVDLNPGGNSPVHITSDQPPGQAEVAAAIDEAGYTLA